MPQHTSNTWALTSDWDLAFDGNGNPKMLNRNEAICQNVANECRLFLHDAYFRYEQGINWLTDQLGKKLQQSVVTSRLREAALSVDGVVGVKSIELDELDVINRVLHGVINLETVYGDGTSYF